MTGVAKFAVGGQKLNLSSIIDKFNGEVISQIMPDAGDKHVNIMLEKARVTLLPGETRMLHSDHG